MPMKIGVYFSLEKIGRKHSEMVALLSTGVCLFINIFVSKGHFYCLKSSNFIEFSDFWWFI